VSAYSATSVPNWTWTLIHGAKVQAIIKKGGVWQSPEDWSLFPYKVFCREMKEERIEELVLIFSAGTPSGKPFSPLGLPPMLWATDMPCGPGKFNSDVGCNADGDKKTLAVKDIEYIPDGWEAGRGTKPGTETFYSPVERKFAFKGGGITWSLTQDGENGGGTLAADGHTTLHLSMINFVQPGKGEKAYDFWGSFSGLSFQFQVDCPPGHDPLYLNCGFTAYFSLKSSFDTELKTYTRQVTGAEIHGPGDDFSEEEPTTTLSLGHRVPLDGGEECICPPNSVAGSWQCSGSWSLTSTPEP
jgi:hypothetical protein